MEQFKQILDKYSFPKRTEKAKTAIAEIESIIKFNLPEDYKIYLENYKGFEKHIGQEYLVLWDTDEVVDTNKNYGIIDSLPDTIGIGGNGAGEFIAIELTNKDNYRIVLSPFIDLDKQFHVEIGTSFTDFLVRLDNGQEWFE